jgi:gamma-glutamylcyclotransferase (GGCT)/AIG2-like uncharacterized protein YtfP
MQNKFNIFVYGTLKKAQRAHGMLENADFVCKAFTKPHYGLYSCISYPALIEESPGSRIQGEIYHIDETIKHELDIYEGVSYGLYEFKEIQIENFAEPVFAYIFLESVENWEKISGWPCDSRF